MAGYGLDLQHARQQQAPDQRHARQLRSGFRRSRRRRLPILRTTVDLRGYYEIVTDLVGILHLQGGDMLGFTKCPTGGGMCVDERRSAHARRLQDGSQSGARLRARGASVRATSRRSRPAIRSAARCTGAPVLRCNTRSTSCRRIPGSAAPCSSIPARSGVTEERRSLRRPAKSTAPSRVPRPAPSFIAQLRPAVRRHARAARFGRRQHDLGLAVRAAALRLRLSDRERVV